MNIFIWKTFKIVHFATLFLDSLLFQYLNVCLLFLIFLKCYFDKIGKMKKFNREEFYSNYNYFIISKFREYLEIHNEYSLCNGRCVLNAIKLLAIAYIYI